MVFAWVIAINFYKAIAMEINDSNKVSVTALFSKLISQSNVATGVSKSFASFLGQNDAVSELKNASPVEAKPVKNNKNEVFSDNNKVERNEDGAEIKEKPVEKIEEKKKTAERKTENPVENEAAVSQVSTEVKENAPVEAVAENVPAEVPAELANDLNPTAEAEGFDAFKGMVENEDVMADGVSFEGKTTVGGERVDLSADSNMLSGTGLEKTENGFIVAPQVEGAVKMQEPVLNENMETLAKVENTLEAQNVDATLVVADVQGDVAPQNDVFQANLPKENNLTPAPEANMQKLPSEKMTALQPEQVAEAVVSMPVDAETNEDTLQKLAVASPKLQKNEDSLGTKNSVQNYSEEMVSQAEQIENIIGDKQLNIQVSVKEEKNSYQTAQTLIKDRLALDQAVDAVDVAESSDQSISPAAVSQTNQTQSVQQNVQTPIAAPVAAQNFSDEMSGVVVKGNDVGGLQTNSGHVANLAAGEAVNNAVKTENHTKTETSFRDVYKGMSKEAVEQVKVNITKSAIKGVDTIEVRLKPEDLGHIEIKMQIKDGKLHAHIISSRPETMETLQKDSQILEKAFNDAGFQTDENSLSFSYRGDSQAEYQQDFEAKLRNFIGEVFEAEANEDLLNAETANQNFISENGVNIKV